MSWSFEDQLALRNEAMRWLTLRTNDGTDSILSRDLLDFSFRGEPFRLMDPQAGIRKPAGWSAALSMRTVFRREGAARPYDDSVTADGLIQYKWRGHDPDHSDNRALRAGMEQDVPLIWFVGVGPALYQPIYPVYLLQEDPEHHQFLGGFEMAHEMYIAGGSPVEQHVKKYVTREVRQRLHQPVFRATVMRAYRTQCAVCALRHGELLDAAHIIPDREDGGIASVRNGLALCKMHHAAFDARILGIRPDYVVEIREDLLEEIDGPMLKHGLQSMHGAKLRVLPGSKAERPDSDLLAVNFEKFKQVG